MYNVEILSRGHVDNQLAGNYFEHVTLKSLGLHIQQDHPLGNTCYNPRPASTDNFVVIDINGVHMVSLDFCGCKSAQTNYKQLLHSRWFPATTTEPQTATTFAVLMSSPTFSRVKGIGI
ncbi:hypothetical protein JVT61DRAFT_7830 [Boletus reticuloceps]|uniref:CxC2-like cysteine cluster KDZ transposase-associated domain-containing protein n=1 Tax=Boletus reticuloceps TaxID=495285 RepID=A0A8I3A6V2_9AGAM|nr:hypothetical protein JVT61DRAFT_7830 [Boletus reticuloceps]